MAADAIKMRLLYFEPCVPRAQTLQIERAGSAEHVAKQVHLMRYQRLHLGGVKNGASVSSSRTSR